MANSILRSNAGQYMPEPLPKLSRRTSESPRHASLSAFTYNPHTRLIFGNNAIDRIGDAALEIGAKKVLLVTDKGIVGAGHAGRVQKVLQSCRLKVTVFDSVRENPTTGDVDACVKVARAAKVDLLIGLGGGSSMDTAKGCNFVLTNGGRMQDYWGVGKASKPMLPLIAVPTTAGTGSECQSAALITDEQTHQKMACLDPKAAARIAILDPVITLSQPFKVTVCTGIDAVAHAVESAVTLKRNAFSEMFSRKAFNLCAGALPKIVANANDLEGRGQMLLGAAFAGLAIENSMLGAAHSAANPLTAHFGIVHGHAVGLLLPHVVRFNSKDPGVRAIYRELRPDLASWLEKLLKLCDLPHRLRDCQVKRSKIPSLAEEAARQWTAQFNPRPVAQPDFQSIYAAAF